MDFFSNSVRRCRINRPGGHGKITKVDRQEDDQVRLTVKYILGGFDKDLDPCLIEIPEELGTRDRKRRTLLTVTPPAAAEESKKKPRKKKSSTVASLSKENTQNHRTASQNTNKTRTNAPEPRQVETKKVVKRRSRSFKNKKKVPSADKHKFPADLPLEITVHPRPTFASPMNEKGVEDKRKYMLGGGAVSHYPRSSLSTDYARSAAALCRDDEEDEDNDPLSDSNSQPASGNGDDKSEESIPPPSAKRLSLDQAAVVSAGPIQRVTLQSVVDREMKEAANFVQDVLQNKSGDKIATKPEQQQAKETKATAPKASPRQEELMAVFLSLMEHSEGEAEEANLSGALNRQSQGSKDFTELEVQVLMDSLAESNKIMRCDGSIYWL